MTHHMGDKILQTVDHLGEKMFIYNIVQTCNDEQRTKNLLFFVNNCVGIKTLEKMDSKNQSGSL
jgi:hypothetical protein